MFVVVAYDIVDDKRRNKAAKTMEAFGDRVQRSVFECNLEKAEFQKMTKRLGRYIDEEVDSARIYMICEGCKKQTVIMGLGTLSEDPELIIV